MDEIASYENEINKSKWVLSETDLKIEQAESDLKSLDLPPQKRKSIRARLRSFDRAAAMLKSGIAGLESALESVRLNNTPEK